MLINIEKLHSLIDAETEKLDFGKEPGSLYDPLYYILSLGGKRMRPLLTLLAYSLYKDDPKQVVNPALSVEVFHNFTLMHDDIMDKAPLRRGNTTVHEKWNSNIAILSGDVMLVKAYDLLMDVDDDKLKKVLTVFNECATFVCEGQQIDMDFENRDEVTKEEYLEMIKLKTAALLGLSLELGAILANAPDSDCKALKKFGINIGIGFQLKDDLLDVYADKAKFGKQVGGDIIANKKTLLLLEAIRLADKSQLKELKTWLSETKFDSQEKIHAVKKIYDELDLRSITENLMNCYFEKGMKSLALLSAPKPKVAILKNFAQNLINREK